MASALAVHLADGSIEAHFMFFVMIIVISLYEDWRPFSSRSASSYSTTG